LFLLPFVFVDAGDNLVMVDDVAMPSNPPVVTVDKEKLEEATFDETLLDEVALEVNVSQQSHKKKTIQANGAHSSRSFGMGSSIVS
jgi:hypothetical protein